MTALAPGIGVAAAIGRRPYMEDRWAVHATGAALFAAVYDGHGGAAVADRAAAQLHPLVFQALADGLRPADALRQAFDQLDRRMPEEDCGSTAAAVLLTADEILTAHVGDSRVIRVGPASAEGLTRDHRIEAADERARVVRMGARLEPPYVVRAGHGLMVTRSLGDRWFRPVGVIAEPEMGHHVVRSGDVAIVLATDGVWDVLDHEEAGAVVRETASAQAGADALVRAALAAGTSDNVTGLVVRLVDLRPARAI